jgi:hypothetical protein
MRTHEKASSNSIAGGRPRAFHTLTGSELMVQIVAAAVAAAEHYRFMHAPHTQPSRASVARDTVSPTVAMIMSGDTTVITILPSFARVAGSRIWKVCAKCSSVCSGCVRVHACARCSERGCERMHVKRARAEEVHDALVCANECDVLCTHHGAYASE